MKPKHWVACSLSVAVVALVATSTATACFVRSPQPVQVWLDHIDVVIKDQVAVKTYHCTFLNPNASAVVGGTCYMELEPGSRVSNMSVVVNGNASRAEILNVDQSNKVFTEIVKEGGSTALLEYYGNQLIQTRVPAIPPGGTVVVKLQYTTVLESKDGLVRLQMLNTNPKADLKALKSASVRVAIKSSLPLKNVYSPTHPIKLEEEPDSNVVVTWSEENYLPKTPFVLYYQTARDELGASLLAHREPGADGHFMLMLSPTIGRGAGAVSESDILPKDVVFCVDTSGSMLQEGKMEQAREALDYCLKHLRPADRFNIVDFSTTVRAFDDDGLVAADADNVARAKRYVDRLAPHGGTAIDEALETSLRLLEQGKRLKMILFLTDGLPTIGERSPEEILGNMDRRNTKDVRVFVFGKGLNVNTKLLDFLALRHRGEAEYVLPKEDIQQKIATFYDRVGSPVLTDVEIEFENIEVDDVFPRRFSDVFRGEQVIVYGRYRGDGERAVRVKGRVGGEVKTFRYALDFPAVSTNERNAFVPRLWAGEMVDYLMDQIREAGAEDPELVDEVTRLAKRHGIVTPFTSFLMVEDTCNLPHTEQVAEFNRRLRTPGQLLAERQYGNAAVQNAWQQSRNRRSRVSSGNAAALYTQVADGLQQENRGGTQALAAVRYIGNRTFYNSRGVWYDSRYDATQARKVRRVRVGSEEYLNLLGKQPTLAKQMAQGNVVIQVKGGWYQFHEEDEA